MSRFREWSSRAAIGLEQLVAGWTRPARGNALSGLSLRSRRGFRFELDRGSRVARREFLMSLGALSVAWRGLCGGSDSRLWGLSRRRAMFVRKTDA